jgi:penicillin-binding protein 1B
VEAGIKLVDDQITKMRTKKVKIGKNKFETKVLPGPQAQVALVALDPRTGAVLALVGGRNYGLSQLNHAVAKRPTGSIFKPFVYAAAMNTALDGATNILTPASMVDDSATTFAYGDQIYEPRNYKEEYHGPVTLRYALAMSLNNATVKVAEEVGYDKVADLAKSAGITSVKATPAMALGAYDATPLEMASAYTAFSNDGVQHFADPRRFRTQFERRRDAGLHARETPGARSPRCLRHDRHDAGRRKLRPGVLRRPRTRIQRACRRKDWQLA